MKIKELLPGLSYCGIQDPDLRVFDIVMMTEFGTTYNSYILKGSEKTALFETAKLKFYDQYLSQLEAVAPVSSIDYIIINHTEPDHSGSIENLIQLNPNIKIVGTATAINFLKHILNRDFYSITVSDGDTLSLGDKTLTFMPLPNLHWPDSMYTYLEEDGVLFTCDSFGAHYSHEGILRSSLGDEEGYLRAAKYYFDNIIGPYKNPYMNNALGRIEGLSINMICTGHGPVLDSHIDEIISLYKEWSAPLPQNEKKTVVIPYVSAYGYTEQLAEKIKEGILGSGDIDVVSYDMVTADEAQVLADLARADGILLGTPTIIGEALKPIWNITTSMFSPTHKGKLASAFGSYGWSGEGVPHIIERLSQLKLKVLEGYRVRFKPSESELIGAYDFGYNFGCVLLEKENDRTDKKAKPKTYYKCLVCGEIFDSSIEFCPVCGVGKENFVLIDEDDISLKKNTDEKFIVIGGGAAAYNAAKAIRERNDTCEILMISREGILPYNRPMLTKAMLADFSDDQMAVAGSKWYEENRINVLLNKEVASLDTSKKQITCSDGETFEYSKLIYALGSESFVPPIPGASLDGVTAIKNVNDTRRIKSLLPGVKNAVVIGGGVLGLEAAWELHKTGCGVTVLEGSPQIMGRQIDGGAAGLLKKIMDEKKIVLRDGVKIAKIEGDTAAQAVSIEGGESFPCEMVIMSTGVRPNTAIAKDAGIEIGRSIIVDANMRTSDPHVYACGDCAEYNGVNLSLWSQSVEMGKVAGACAAGDDIEYVPVNGALNFNGMGTSLFSLGDNGKDANKQYKTVEFMDAQKNHYEKYYFANNRLTGVILIGDVSKMPGLTEAVANGAPPKDTIKI